MIKESKRSTGEVEQFEQPERRGYSTSLGFCCKRKRFNNKEEERRFQAEKESRYAFFKIEQAN